MTQASAGTASDQSATGSFFKPGLRPAPENQLADHGSRLELLVRLAQIGRVDGRERLLQRAAQLSGVEPVGDLVEQAMLLDHVGRLEARPREHELPAQGRALRAHQVHRQRLLAADDRDQRARRGDELPHRRPVRVEVVEVRDVLDRLLHLGRQVLAVVDDFVGAELLYPRDALRARGGAVARTLSRASRASWMPIEPTPPAPPMMSIVFPASLPLRSIFMRSKKASHAVIAVSGMAAAGAKGRRFGLRPTMRSSTRWNSLFAPGRVTSPA